MIRSVYMCVVVCSACGKETDELAPDADAAFAQAAENGWARIPKLSSKGRPTLRCDDLCPTCAPDWEPRQFDTRERAKCPGCGQMVPVLKNRIELQDHLADWNRGRCRPSDSFAWRVASGE